MTSTVMKQRTKKLALSVLTLCGSLPPTPEGRAIRYQLVRSGTSVGANYRAAGRSRSRKEFAARLGIAEEEADESLYWIELAVEAELVTPEAARPVWKEMNEITKILVATLRTLKRDRKKASAKSQIPNPKSQIAPAKTVPQKRRPA